MGVRTFQSATKLKEQGANVCTAYEYLEDDFKDVMARISIMQTAYRYQDNILIAYNNEDSYVSRALLAKVGNELLATVGIDAVFTLGYVEEGEVAISARSSRNINVQIIMEALGGGGHFSMAACQLHDYKLDDATNELEVQISQYLEERGE